jgi:aminoglycoside phosphotransferase (APT) family kinase protein
VRAHLGRAVRSVRDRGTWFRDIFEVTTDDGQVVFLKAHPLGATKEPQVVRLFHKHGLPAPHVLAVDTTCQIVPQPYLIQERVGGRRLGDIVQGVDKADEAEVRAVYEVLGRFYARMHAIHHARSGYWVTSPDEPFDVSPNDYMYQAEIVNGAAKRALEQGRVSQQTYDRAVALWAAHLPYLKDHEPSLIHGSPLPWTIYLDRDGGGWYVTKVMDLTDVLWWDPAYDLAFLRYPPFAEIKPAWWEAFLRGYGAVPERKRLLLYAVMQRLCAAMGTYWEPPTPRNRAWAAQHLADVDLFMDQIEHGAEKSGFPGTGPPGQACSENPISGC